MSTEIQISKQDLSRLRDIGRDADGELQGMITTAYSRAGQKMPEAKDVRNITADFRNQLARLYPALTVADVARAMENGVLGEYGEYFGLNIVTFISWVRAYASSDEYRKSVRQRHSETAGLLAARTEPTEAEREKALRERFDRLLDEFKATGACNDRKNLVYDWLDSRGEITFTADEKREFMERAKAEIRAETKQRKLEVGIERRVPYDVILNELEKSEPAKDTADMVIARAKKLALSEWFKRREK